MVRDPDGELARVPVPTRDDAPPLMFRQPLDSSPPWARVGELEAMQALRRDRATRLHAGEASADILTKGRAWAGRISGRADRRLLRLVADAVEELAAHNDAIVDRLNLQLDREGDVSSAFGEEITRLRAEVIYLRGLVADAGHQGG